MEPPDQGDCSEARGTHRYKYGHMGAVAGGGGGSTIVCWVLAIVWMYVDM